MRRHGGSVLGLWSDGAGGGVKDKGKLAPSALRAEGAAGQPGPAAQDKPAESASVSGGKGSRPEGSRKTGGGREGGRRKGSPRRKQPPAQAQDASSEFLDTKAVSVADLAGEWRASKPDAPVELFLLKTDPEGKGHVSAAFALHGDPDKWESVGAFNVEGPVTVKAADGKATLQAGDWRWSVEMRSDRKLLRMTLLTRRRLIGPAWHRYREGCWRGCHWEAERWRPTEPRSHESGTVVIRGSLRAAFSREEERRRRSAKDHQRVHRSRRQGVWAMRTKVRGRGIGPTAKTSKFKRDMPAGGPMPLKLQPDPRGDETAFWVRGPAALGPEGRRIEIEPIPFVLCGESTGAGSLEDAEKDLELMSRTHLSVPA